MFDDVGVKCTIEEFIKQFTIEELCDFVGGQPPTGVANTGCFGPIKHRLGTPAVPTADGPAGLRLEPCTGIPTTAWPCATLLACSWDPELIYEVGKAGGAEVRENNIGIWLTPALNIHRDPLCGRNFEYYSEDPYVTGKIAAAAVRGVQRSGLSACPKHFACNNQEHRRSTNDSVVSQRALREIYLKGFEICVKEAAPKNIMTSYNKINGVWGHYHYDLVATILRGEWGYNGNVMTDWWMQSSASPEFPNLRDQAYRVRAQVDVLMPGGGRSLYKKPDGTLLKTYGKKDGITLGEMQLCAKHVLACVLDVKER